ncbi:MAG: gamma-glutamyl-gamma-aminobutyrate hydrolase family protein [Acidimicrobiia bacterium]|nr:gamma-glutamyl-gamma-aminobutyrate hydrolase family protein [Acidimicrobiia bacterium]
MRPVIGITTRPKLVASSAGESETHTLQRTYTQSVLRAGGVPVLLSPVPDRDVATVVDRLDGLVLSGGGDIEVERYGGTANDRMYGMDFDRDEFEIQLALCAAERRLPTLAICRGMQVVNVALGGTLIEDIPTEIGSMDHSVIGHHVFDGHQHVRLEAGCRVADAVKKIDLEVNSIHHQAVRDLAPGFRAVGWADDGVIEAIEHHDPDWPLLAVQWHPEYLGEADDEASWNLFHTLVEYANARALAL